MQNKLLTRFRQQEADTLALSVKFNRWSRIMIALLIREQEEKLVASDLPVDIDTGTDDFWEQLA